MSGAAITAAPSNQDTAAAHAPAVIGLAGALHFLAQSHGIAVTKAALEQGLTGSTGELALEALGEAAARAGLEPIVQAFDRRNGAWPPLPCIAFRHDGQAVLIDRMDAASGLARARQGTDGDWCELATSDISDTLPVLTALRARDLLKGGAGSEPPVSSRWFWPYIARFWPDFLQMAVAGFLLNVLGLALPIFTMNVYDRVIPNGSTTTLWALFWGVLIVLAFDFLLRCLRAWVTDEVGRRVDLRVSGKLFDQLLNLRLAGKPRSSGLLASQIKEFESVREVMTSGTVIAVTDALFIVIFLAVMHLLVGALVIVPLVAVFLVLSLTMLAQIPISSAMESAQAAAAQRHGTLVEAVVGLETIKLTGAHGIMRERWNRSVDAASRTLAHGRFWSSLTTNILSTVSQGVTIATTVWGVYLIMDGQITMGALIAANLLAGRVLAPLSGIAQTLTRSAQARSALRGLSRFMALPSEAVAPENATGLIPRDGSVRFQNVSFQYPGSALKALDRVSFSVQSGEKIGIIGRIGSGKTTFSRLIAGLYSPSKGAILIDGIDIRQYDVADLRQFVGVLPQDAELFTGTLRDNIVIGCLHASEADLRYALDVSGVAQFIASHPLGLSLPITERGAGLSGGQRQSVALARFLIRRPRIMVLDEPTAAMDQVTENALIQRLGAITQSGCTLFISTHRDSLLRLVDRIIVMDSGRIAMDGPRADVLAALLAGGKAEKKAQTP